MPRSGWQKPDSDQRLSDHLTIAMLTRAYPPELVDDAIAATGRIEQRQRLLPARVVLYYVLAMAVFTEASYEEVMRRLLEGLAWQQRWATPWQVPTKAAIFKARTRLGVEPLAELHRRAVHPLIDSSSQPRRAVITVDHFELNLSGPAGDGAEPANGMLPITALVEADSHTVLDLTLHAAPADGVNSLTDRLCPDVLYVADRRTGSAQLQAAVQDHGSDLLWACSTAPANAESERQLADGSRLISLTDPVTKRTVRTRVIRPLPHTSRPAETNAWLLTTLTDPVAAPAETLRELYRHRAKITSCLEDLRVHQRASRLVPRSQSVDGATQEFYGLLLAHYAIQSLLGVRAA